jgi:hypothetical protein
VDSRVKPGHDAEVCAFSESLGPAEDPQPTLDEPIVTPSRPLRQSRAARTAPVRPSANRRSPPQGAPRKRQGHPGRHEIRQSMEGPRHDRFLIEWKRASPVGTVDQVTAEGRPFEESVACFGHAAPPKARKRNLGAERPSLLIGQQNGLSPTPPPLSGRGAPVLERSRATGRPRIANPVAQIPIATGGSSRSDIRWEPPILPTGDRPQRANTHPLARRQAFGPPRCRLQSSHRGPCESGPCPSCRWS